MNTLRKFTLEAHVRQFIREEARANGCIKNLFWAEPGRGSSVGIADLLVARISAPGGLLPVEVKRGMILDGEVSARLRPSQKRFARDAEACGVPVFCCIGLHGTRRLIITRSLSLLSGKTRDWVEYCGWNRSYDPPFPKAPSSFLFGILKLYQD